MLVVASAPSRSRPSSTTSPEGYRPGDPAYRRVLVGLMFGGLANFVLLYYVQPLLPTLASAYGVSAGTSAEALSVATLALAVALLVVGPVSDVVGRVPLMRWSLLVAGSLGVVSAFAPSWSALLLVRGLEGAALAALPAVALAYLREEIHPGSRLAANAVYITGTAVGGALGRLLPGPLAAAWGWSGATLVISGLTLGAAGALWALLPASVRFERSRPDLGRLLTGTVRTVRDPALLAICLVGCAGMGAFVGVYNAITFRLEAAPFSLAAGAVVAYLAYPVAVTAPWCARRTAGRLGRGPAVLAGLALLGLGTALTASSHLALLMVGLGGLTFAFIGIHSLAGGWVVDRAQQLGLGAAQASSTYLLLYYAGGAFFGALTAHRWVAGGWGAVLTVSLSLAVAGVLAALVAVRADRRTATTATAAVHPVTA